MAKRGADGLYIPPLINAANCVAIKKMAYKIETFSKLSSRMQRGQMALLQLFVKYLFYN